jgi:hypothetical protein
MSDSTEKVCFVHDTGTNLIKIDALGWGTHIFSSAEDRRRGLGHSPAFFRKPGHPPRFEVDSRGAKAGPTHRELRALAGVSKPRLETGGSDPINR